HVDHTNGVAPADEIIEAFGQQGRLPAIWPRNEALHPIPPTESRENHSGGRVFTQPGSKAALGPRRLQCPVCPRTPEDLARPARTRPRPFFVRSAAGPST